MDVIRIAPTSGAIGDLREAIKKAKASTRATLIHIHSNPLLYSPDGEGWWDVPVAGVSTLPSTQAAHKQYLKSVSKQKPLLGKGASERS
jgi:3D-(3,5/4)-trihydroxycyclohexane-1,2-dione acylhydrolase (decyclizing)